MKSSTCRVWATPRAAVGSSSSTSLGSPSSARAMATIWRWPPESEATGVVTLGIRAESERMSSPELLLHLDVVDRPEPPQRPRVVLLVAEEQVPGHVEVVGEREVLVDGRDPEVRRVLRALDVRGLAEEPELARVGQVHARDGLDERRLAGAVVADQGDHLAGVDVEVHVGERLHGAEALVHAVEVENGNAHVPVAPFARPGCRAGPARPAGPGGPTGCRPPCRPACRGPCRSPRGSRTRPRRSCR